MPDTNGNGDTSTTTSQQVGWMSDVQRALALTLIGTFAITVIAATMRVVIAGDAPAIADMAKTLQAAMVNMSLIALGFFFGNTMAKMAQDAGQQKVVEKLTSTQPPTGGPVAPVPAPSPIVVVAWWSLLTDPERAVIAAAAAADPKVDAIMIAAKVGKATPEDLAYLTSKNPPLLTQDSVTKLLGA